MRLDIVFTIAVIQIVRNNIIHRHHIPAYPIGTFVYDDLAEIGEGVRRDDVTVRIDNDIFYII